MRFIRIFLGISLFSSVAWASPTVSVKSAVLNVRSSPGAKNSENLVGDCQLKKGDQLVATDFEFVDGVAWCKASPPEREGCAEHKEVWFAGSDRFIEELGEFEDPYYSGQEASKSETEAANCTNCNSSVPIMNIPDPMDWVIKMGSPVRMRPCEEGQACDCRGLASQWGIRRDPILGGESRKFHRGVDVSAPRGTPIYAVADGVVTLAARRGGYGRRIEIQHFDRMKSQDNQLEKSEDGNVMGARKDQSLRIRACGIERAKTVESATSSYSHLKGYAKGIKSGVVVKKGQLIGYVNNDGRSDGDHLHFEVDIEGLACQDGNRSGGTCDPQLFHGFPSRSKKWTYNFDCNPPEETEP